MEYVEFDLVKLVPCQPLACGKLLTEGNNSFNHRYLLDSKLNI